MELYRRQNRLLLACILLSLLLHLLLLLMPDTGFFPPPPPPEPVYVEVRPPPAQERPRELDIPVREELEKPRETPAERLGPTDQVVEQEQAPQGEDDMDVSARPPAPKPTPAPSPPKAVEKPVPQQEQPPAPQVTEQPEPQQPQPQPERPAVPETEPARVTPEGERPQSESAPQPEAAPRPEPAAPAKPLPDLQALTRISPQTLASIESEWRRKHRPNLDQGDTVWLDTEQDLLNSFMRRFRDKIYLVWDYPAEALRLMQQGTCLLRITINRRGDVENVQLLESSGYPLLDREAMESVRQGATYGPLPRAYPHEQLNIMAFFQYGIGGNIQYRRRVY